MSFKLAGGLDSTGWRCQ